MADEDELDVDIEGDFDVKIGSADSEIAIDTNEPPSRTVHLQPEFTQHPWVLEQGWSLDHCNDEKSKAAIERMLMEEQYYINGQHPGTKPTKKTGPIQFGTWTTEEKDLFLRGLEIHGRSWTKISEIIMTRTPLQVRNYAQHYFKHQKPSPGKIETPTANNQPCESLEGALLSVTTAQPTVTVTSPKYSRRGSPKSSKNTTKSAPSLLSSAKSKLDSENSQQIRVKRLMIENDPTVKRIETVSDDENCEIDVELDDEMCVDIPQDSCLPVSIGPSPSHDIEMTSLCDASGENFTDNTHMEDVDEQAVNTEENDPHLISEKYSEVSGPSVEEVQEDDFQAVSDMPEKSHFEPITSIEIKENYISNKFNFEPVIPSVEPDESVILLPSEKPHFEPNIRNVEAEETDISENSHFELIITHVETTENDYEGISDKTDAVPSDTIVESEENAVGDISEKSIQCSGPIDSGSTFYQTVAENVCDQTGTIETEGSAIESDVTFEMASTDVMSGDARCFCDVTEDTEDECECPMNNREAEGASLESLDDVEGSRERSDQKTKVEESDYLGGHIQTSAGEAIFLPPPAGELQMNRLEVMEQEKEIHSEFFIGRPSKTPERYLKIRNYILDAWDKCKPAYLNKTSVRPGLKNCGDVNSIGRIHAYLEQIGAINFGCEQVNYYKRIRPPPPSDSKERKGEAKTHRPDKVKSRKRRVRDVFGDWIDEAEVEGRTIEHKEPTDENPSHRPRVRIRKIRKDTYWYDPFKLIHCENFPTGSPAPFAFNLSCSAMAIMDLHAHTSKTEVIGLLGGRYNQECQALEILTAEPCNSLSTGMQCEMDPVSQTQAMDCITSGGYSVVGWYHSHPTFAPNPSVRDIETQEKFQDWFSQGGLPFIGVIVNPYNKASQSPCSTFKCLIVRKERRPAADCHTPFQFEYQVAPLALPLGQLLLKMRDLIVKVSQSSHRVEMLRLYRRTSEQTCLEKMLLSMKDYLRIHVDNMDKISIVLHDLVVEHFSLISLEDVSNNQELSGYS